MAFLVVYFTKKRIFDDFIHISLYYEVVNRYFAYFLKGQKIMADKGFKDKVAGKANELKGKVQQAAGDVKDKAQDAAEDVKDKVDDAKENIKK